MATAVAAARPVVLVVDDEMVNRVVLSRMLARLGFDVIQARDGNECLRICHSSHGSIACVLLDLNMPILDGWGTAVQLRSWEKHEQHVHHALPLVACSTEDMSGRRDSGPAGGQGPTTAEYTLSCGIDQILPKPPRMEDLRAVLDKYMQQQQHQHQQQAAAASATVACPPAPAFPGAKPLPPLNTTRRAPAAGAASCAQHGQQQPHGSSAVSPLSPRDDSSPSGSESPSDDCSPSASEDCLMTVGEGSKGGSNTFTTMSADCQCGAAACCEPDSGIVTPEGMDYCYPSRVLDLVPPPPDDAACRGDDRRLAASSSEPSPVCYLQMPVPRAAVACGGASALLRSNTLEVRPVLLSSPRAGAIAPVASDPGNGTQLAQQRRPALLQTSTSLGPFLRGPAALPLPRLVAGCHPAPAAPHSEQPLHKLRRRQARRGLPPPRAPHDLEDRGCGSDAEAEEDEGRDLIFGAGSTDDDDGDEGDEQAQGPGAGGPAVAPLARRRLSDLGELLWLDCVVQLPAGAGRGPQQQQQQRRQGLMVLSPSPARATASGLMLPPSPAVGAVAGAPAERRCSLDDALRPSRPLAPSPLHHRLHSRKRSLSR